jgi:hypothetical protein
MSRIDCPTAKIETLASLRRLSPTEISGRYRRLTGRLPTASTNLNPKPGEILCPMASDIAPYQARCCVHS